MNLYDIHIDLLGTNPSERSYTVILAFSRKRCSENLTFDSKHTKQNLLDQRELPLTDTDGICIGYASEFEIQELNTVKARLMIQNEEFWQALYSRKFFLRAQLAGSAVRISTHVRTGARQIEIVPKALVLATAPKPAKTEERIFAGAMRDVKKLVTR